MRISDWRSDVCSSDLDINIVTQIAFVVLVGLAAKNAILIVEFARAREQEGLDPPAAALEACRLRLRPILMTSIAFIAGAVPLTIAAGAGAKIDRKSTRLNPRN